MNTEVELPCWYNRAHILLCFRGGWSHRPALIHLEYFTKIAEQRRYRKSRFARLYRCWVWTRLEHEGSISRRPSARPVGGKAKNQKEGIIIHISITSNTAQRSANLYTLPSHLSSNHAPPPQNVPITRTHNNNHLW